MHRRRFLFNDTAATEIYTLSLHDALPISVYFADHPAHAVCRWFWPWYPAYLIPSALWCLFYQGGFFPFHCLSRSAEHTSELQSRHYLVCRLLLATKRPPDSPIPHPHSRPA